MLWYRLMHRVGEGIEIMPKEVAMVERRFGPGWAMKDCPPNVILGWGVGIGGKESVRVRAYKGLRACIQKAICK